MIGRALFLIVLTALAGFGQVPAIEPGVSHDLTKWRASRYSFVRYKLNLTLEKMSPVLKGTIEIRLKVEEKRGGGEKETATSRSEPGAIATGFLSPIILDWRAIRGSESLSTVSNVSINGTSAHSSAQLTDLVPGPTTLYEVRNEHLIFRDGVVAGENVIKLDFTSPILTSGSAITRYVDKEDGSEYIYSLFVPSDASTAFPVFDQPDLKGKLTIGITGPRDWNIVSNNSVRLESKDCFQDIPSVAPRDCGPTQRLEFHETKPISTYVFAFAAGPFERVSEPPALAGGMSSTARLTSGPAVQRSTRSKSTPPAYAGGSDQSAPLSKAQQNEIQKKWLRDDVSILHQVPDEPIASHIYVRKSQLAKFKPHAAEVFRLNREGIKFLEGYFDYKFPFPKYDLVLIPEFPFGGMEHAGATFLRESSVIFPQEPTKNDYISRANVIFHEAAHQWFGDTVTMRWFDDLWLKEGFAEFMAYKTLEKVMPQYNAWKVFYERNKQAAYLTDSTRGTTPIYQEIANLNSAKSAYGNIVYRKAPSFLKQAEFYLGADKFQTAVRTFLKKHDYGNAGWADLVKEFETASGENLDDFAEHWVKNQGAFIVIGIGTCIERKNADQSVSCGVTSRGSIAGGRLSFEPIQVGSSWGPPVKKSSSLHLKMNVMFRFPDGSARVVKVKAGDYIYSSDSKLLETFAMFGSKSRPAMVFPNYQDYGYGIFLLDPKSRDYVLKNIHTEKDDFLRTMMWGSLWDSVREGELDPREYVELVVGKSDAFTRDTTPVTVQKGGAQSTRVPTTITPKGVTHTGETDESTIQTLLGRVSTAMNYYLPEAERDALAPRVESLLIDNMQNASTPGQRITYYRSFLSVASTANARRILKEILRKSVPGTVVTGASPSPRSKTPIVPAQGTDRTMPFATPVIRTKDKFDIVTRLLILGDPEAPKLLADLEKTETSDEAKRYAYAARAGIATAENKAKYWNDFVNNKDISESWIEAAFGTFNSVRHSDLTLPYLQKALEELPNHKRNRKIFFVNGWLGAFIGGQRSEAALAIVSKFLADNRTLDRDLRLKVLENVDLIERAVKIRAKYGKN